MNSRIIDLDLTREILNNINSGAYKNISPVRVSGIPGIDGRTVIDIENLTQWRIRGDEAAERLAAVSSGFDPSLLGNGFGRIETEDGHETLVLSRRELEHLGLCLYPWLSYGVLNGGSATSYADRKKNTDFNPALMDIYDDYFDSAAACAEGKAKGITPAFTNPDGSPGPDFLELKIRALLLENLRWRRAVQDGPALFGTGSDQPEGLFPLFQMTSVYNNSQIGERIREYSSSPYLSDLLKQTGISLEDTLTGVQPMLAAMTHSRDGEPRQIFTCAYGRDGEMLPIPGGHGQNFLILSRIYSYLGRELGKKFVYITNIDNLGNIPDPAALAVTALSGCQGSFEFSFKTPVDTKGGILVRDSGGRLNCADIGAAISRTEVEEYENRGCSILYNCATGLFSLDYLLENLDTITKKLPMRISDQEKDAGAYSQAEQVTWEIIGMMDDFLILGVDKYRRFLAAKLLVESFMTSGLCLDAPGYPSGGDPSKDLKKSAVSLSRGLERLLSSVYGLELHGKRWLPADKQQPRG